MFGLLSLYKSQRRGRGISIIIPFREPKTTDVRTRNLAWLKHYWKVNLPGAELIIGDDPDTSRPFSKSVAINRAVAHSKGDVLVLVDADGFLDADSVIHCAESIRHARKRGFKLWFVPYRKFYRLTDPATIRMLNSNPMKPHVFPEPMPKEDIIGGTDPKVAHWHGALIQIMPREAFETVGGWDERFSGWGGEDHAAMRAMDTLYGPHKTLPGKVLHFWHPMISRNGTTSQVNWKERMWEGQDTPVANSKLCARYYQAYLKPELMRRLVDEWKCIERERHAPSPCPPPPCQLPPGCGLSA
jgi:predicted glycosyltransferase involved in capsule biosynthesis